MPTTTTAQRPGAGLSPSELYERDFHAWTQQQAELLNSQAAAGLDWANLAEEIGDLGKSEKRELESRLQALLAHLLKWRFQPNQRSGSWRATIVEQRYRIARRIAESPSLRSYPGTVLADEYRLARLHAAAEAEADVTALPDSCPFSIAEVLDDAFWPGED